MIEFESIDGRAFAVSPSEIASIKDLGVLRKSNSDRYYDATSICMKNGTQFTAAKSYKAVLNAITGKGNNNEQSK